MVRIAAQIKFTVPVLVNFNSTSYPAVAAGGFMDAARPFPRRGGMISGLNHRELLRRHMNNDHSIFNLGGISADAAPAFLIAFAIG